MPRNKKDNKKYWYLITRIFCPPCGRFTDEFRERQFTHKPANRVNRCSVSEALCYQCQVSMFG